MAILFTREKIGYYSGILGIFATSGFLVLAFLLSPNYNIWTQTISKLGITSGGALPFSLAMYLGAIFMAMFFILTMTKYFFDTRLSQLATFCAVLSAPCMFLVGVFPSKQPTSNVHDFFAVLLFLFFGLATFLYGIYFYKNSKFTAKIISRIGILATLFDLALALSFFFGFDAIIQKIVFISFNIWLICLLYYIHQLMAVDENKKVHTPSNH